MAVMFNAEIPVPFPVFSTSESAAKIAFDVKTPVNKSVTATPISMVGIQ